MEAELREYVSFEGEESVSFLERQGHEGVNDLTRAWFPGGVTYSETAVSRIHWFCPVWYRRSGYKLTP